MLKIYNKEESLTWPNMKTMTVEELKKDDDYMVMFTGDWVIDTTEDGITWSFFPLSNMKEAYGVQEEDPETALQKCLEEKAKREEQAAQDAVTIQNLQEQLDALAGITEGEVATDGQ